MQKHLHRLLLMAVFLLPWVTQAQTPGALDTVPFFCNFEDSVMRSHWVLVNQVGSDITYNHFVISNDTNANTTVGGEYALYVTDESWVCNTCNFPYHYKIGSDQSGAQTYVEGNSYAYIDIYFPQAGMYDVGYWWQCTGESKYDHARIALVPNSWTFQACTTAWDSTTTVANQYWGAYSCPSSFIPLDNEAPLSLSLGFEYMSKSINVPSAGVWRLAVMWRNDGNVGEEPPITFDDITITRQSCPVAHNISVSHLNTTSATLNWAADTSVLGWILSWDTAGVVNMSNTSYVTTNSYNFSNLSVGGRYNVTLRTVCTATDTSMPASYSFSTLSCPPLTHLPYTFDFDSATTKGSTTVRPVIPCWTHVNTASTYYGYPYLSSTSGRAHTGTYSLYFYYPSSTASYDPNATIVLPAIDLDSIDLQNVVVSFWLASSSTSYEPNMLVGVMTDPTNPRSFVAVDSAQNNTTTPIQFSLPLSAYQGTGNFIALRSGYPTGGYAYSYGYVDDIVLTYEPCTRPGLRVDTVTTNMAKFSWTNLGAQYYEYAADTAAQHNPATIYDTTLTLNNLNANTVYTFYIRSVCASGPGEWVTKTFRTNCGDISLPYVQDFENETTTSSTSRNFAPCWHLLNDATTYYGYPYISASTTYNHTAGGGKGLYWYRSNTASYGSHQIIIFPPTIPTADSLQVGFWCKASSATYIPTFAIGVMTDPDSISTFVTVDTVVHSVGTEWTYYEIPLNSYHGNGHYVAIRANNNGTSWYAYVDDLSLDYIPTCPHPVALTQDTNDQTSITFHWSGPANGSEWVINVGNMEYTTTDTFYTVYGLSPSTTYDVSVRAVCDLTDTSYVTTASMMTACGAIASLPFTMDFESCATTTTTSRTFIPCWGHYNDGTTYFGYPYINGTATYNHTAGGTKALYWYSTSTANTYGNVQYVMLPEFDTSLFPINTLQLTFWSKPNSATYHPYLILGIMTDPNDLTTFEVYDTINIPVGTSWVRNDISLANFNGHGSFIAMKYPRQGTSIFAMDDIVVDLLPNCQRPAHLEQIYAAVDSMIVRWDANNGSSWYVTVDSTEMEVTDSVLVLTNLAPNTPYTISVATLCDGDTSEFETATFRTACAPIATLPWTEGFENYTNSTTAVSGIMPNCYDYIMLSATATYTTGSYLPCLYYGGTSTSAYIKHSGNYSFRPCGKSYCMLPEFAVPSDTLMMNVWMGVSSASYTVEVGILDANNVFHSLYQPEVATEMRNYTFYFHGAPQGRIAFYNHYVGDSYDYSYVYIDDITVDYIPSCVPPQVDLTSISNNDAQVVWHGGNASTYELRYGGNSILVNDTAYLLTALNANTSYSVKVRGICGAGDTSIWSNTYNFRTYCNPVSVPYYENFDSLTNSTAATTGVYPSCWSYILTNPTYATETYVPTIYYSTAYAHSGHYSMRLYGNGYHCLPPMDTTLNVLMLTFNNYITGSYYGLEVGVLEGSTFVPIQDVTGVSTTNVQRTAFFNGYTGTSRIIAFRNYYTSSASTGYSYNYIDDIAVEYAPTCIPVAAYSATNVSTTGATVHWGGTDAPAYEVEYGLTGFTRGQGTSQIVTADSITIAGLSPSSNYDIYVRAFCSATDTSDWSLYTFATECGYVTAFPYVVNFDNCIPNTTGTMPNCWTKNSNYSTSYPYVSTSYSQTGGQSLYFYYSGANVHTLAALPPMGIALNNLEVSFSIYRTSTTTGYGQIVVGCMTDPDNYSTFVPVDTVEPAVTSTWTSFTVPLSSYTGTGRYIALNAVSTSALATVSASYLDDVIVNYSSCVENVSVDSITTSSALVNWADACNNTQWEIEYGPANFAHGTGTVLSTTSHPVTLSGLSASTSYDVYIRPNNGTDTGFWCNPATFSTICGLVPLPYTENFDAFNGTTYATAGVMPNCWETYSNASSNIYDPHIVGSGAIWFCHSGSNALMMTSGSSTYGDTKIARLPEMAEPISNLQLSFWLCTEDDARQGGVLEVGYLSTDSYSSLYSDFVPVHVINSNDSTVHSGVGPQSNHGHVYALTFDTVPASARFLAFRWTCSTGYFNCAIDDIVVDYAPEACPVPVVSNVTNDYANATISWTANGSNFQVACKPVATSTWSDLVDVQANSYTFSNLTPATAYQFRLRQVCDDSIGTSDWATGSFTTDSLPCFVPQNLAISANNGLSVALDWTAYETQDAWEVAVFNTNYSATQTIAAHPAVIEGLTPGMTYSAAVRAICGNGAAYSDWSDTLEFTTAVCDPVTNLAASVNGTSASISWTPGSNNAGQWEIEYGVAGFSQGEGTMVQVTNTTATINNLFDETSYDVYVRAICGEGYVSNWSDKVSFTTEHIGISHVQGSMTLSIYPNPANGSTTISLSGVDGLVNIAIVDMNGRTLLSDAMECQGDCAKTLTVSNLAQGAYFVRIYSDEVNTVKKLIVR